MDWLPYAALAVSVLSLAVSAATIRWHCKRDDERFGALIRDVEWLKVNRRK